MNQFVVTLLEQIPLLIFFLNLDPFVTVFKHYTEIYNGPQITKSSIKTSLLCSPEYRINP
jgi:hypothetical protein